MKSHARVVVIGGGLVGVCTPVCLVSQGGPSPVSRQRVACGAYATWKTVNLASRVG